MSQLCRVNMGRLSNLYPSNWLFLAATDGQPNLGAFTERLLGVGEHFSARLLPSFSTITLIILTITVREKECVSVLVVDTM